MMLSPCTKNVASTKHEPSLAAFWSWYQLLLLLFSVCCCCCCLSKSEVNHETLLPQLVGRLLLRLCDGFCPAAQEPSDSLNGWIADFHIRRLRAQVPDWSKRIALSSRD